ncbi:hypothetical protein N0V82_006440 [Gnomoniopsis sp. IMI 355080]|nr:hypothetical protein N0V82_006440 [Gnomoniopsis sp. IMI 355080]
MTIDLVTATRLVGPGMARTALAQNKDTSQTDDSVFQESLRLMRQILKLVCVSAIEDLTATTSRHTPAPLSVRVEDVDVPTSYYDLAADLVKRQLGPNLDVVGQTWWQWRKPGSELVRAQWVEMKVDYEERVRKGDSGKKVIFYLHGGAYYLGGVGHDLQIQRHARKQPEHVVLAGDSAGGALSLALLLIIRDQRLPMPAGASLISPWVDLTHSFPSITEPAPFDYVPSHGFHSKPSLAWPPPTPEERRVLGIKENPLLPPDLVVDVDGKPHTVTEQVNMYAPNSQLTYPLVSPIYAATLGGLCPCQVIVGGGELLRDEQLYLAHKMADPTKFPLSNGIVTLNNENPAEIDKFPPTDVELLVFDDGPHAAPTLGHIDIAKHQYRAISRFAAWALASAQGAAVEIEDYRDNHTPPSRTASDNTTSATQLRGQQDIDTQQIDTSFDSSNFEELFSGNSCEASQAKLYKGVCAGDPLPPFEDHMIRYRVDRQGRLYSLEPPHDISALQMPLEELGLVKGEALKGWMRFREHLDSKFASDKRKVFQKRLAQARKGYIPVPNGEIPPPSALVGRRVVGDSKMDESSGVGNRILNRLYWRMEKGGVAADGRKDTMETCNEDRASSIVRPDLMGK